jgi:HAD superfamily hydrolase (TIGR01549 family)
MPTHDWYQQIKALAWDLDGTLYPSSSQMSVDIMELQTRAVAEKLSISLSDAAALYQERHNELKSNTKALNSLGIDGTAFFSKIWDELDLSRYIQPNPALVQAFDQMSNYPHFILTNSNSQAQAIRKLSFIGLSPSRFVQILTSVDLGFNKPDHRAFQGLIQATGQEPGAILYLGDRQEVDIAPAHDLGLKTGLVSNIRPQLLKADIYLEKPEHLASLLEENTQVS